LTVIVTFDLSEIIIKRLKFGYMIPTITKPTQKYLFNISLKWKKKKKKKKKI